MKHYVFGKSVKGASHIRAGTDCQDNYKKIELDDGTVILAVADGHGSSSCPYSKTGSKIAVNVFCDIIRSLYESYSDNNSMLPSFLNREGDTNISKAIDSEWKKRVLERHRKNKRDIPKNDDDTDNIQAVYKQYGTTLIGLLITDTFVFGFQLGDGDAFFVNENGIERVIEAEKILGVETHSLSRENAWEKAVTSLRMIDISEHVSMFFSLSTDGYSNSYSTEKGFQDAVKEYLPLIKEHGVPEIANALPDWLSETSSMGCGDDITMLIAYFVNDETEEAFSDDEDLKDERDQ